MDPVLAGCGRIDISPRAPGVELVADRVFVTATHTHSGGCADVNPLTVGTRRRLSEGRTVTGSAAGSW